MSITSNDAVASCAANKRWLVRSAVAAAIYGGFAVSAMAAEAAATSTTAAAATPATTAPTAAQIEEVQVTGSRIVRKDLSSNSPLTTVDKQRLEDSSFISVEEALNDLPQFMAGGVSNGAGAVTGLQAANSLDGGRGSGDMFNMGLLPDNAGMIGIVVPGAANVNLRGLGANRSLTLIDGHRGMPSNASMTVDLNTIPTVAIGSIEVITGGASAVYGADALAGVTNIKLRQNFEGLSLRVRGGVNEVGDGEEYQVSGLMGSRIADGRGHTMIGIEYSKRNESLWKNRSFMRDVMDSPYASSGDYIFAWEPYYSASGPTGGFNTLQRAWNGNGPSTTAVDSIFADRACMLNNVNQSCIGPAPAAGTPTTAGAPYGGGFYMNADGTLFARSSQFTTGTGATAQTNYFGPQSYTGAVGPTPENPTEIACTFVPASVNRSAAFNGKPCISQTNRVDYDRWLTTPREAYSFIGSAEYDITDSLTAFANFNFASSNTETRREPAPFSGGFGAIIPFHTSVGGDGIYAPSVVQTPTATLAAGATRPEYRAGGTKGTNCAPTGGCTMAQAFPLPGDVLAANGTVTTPGELRRLLESRVVGPVIASTGVNATNPFRGLSSCNQYTLVPAGTPGALVNPTGGASYVRQADPNTGQPLSNCGPNAGWQVNTQLAWMPPRGTNNTSRLYDFSAGLRGDLGFSDWTWELYLNHGDSQTQTSYDGFTSLSNYMKIMSAPNYGRGFLENGLSSKYITCTSGINPFDPNLVVSQDCVDAISSNQIDRNSMIQTIYEANTQGHLFELPAGEVRVSLGATYRTNDFQYTPDSLRERDYTNDTSAGQFASGVIDESVNAKEFYGELLVPVLKDLPGIRLFELELGARHSEYSTGQSVNTYKALGSWEPVSWLRVRGGYNRAERAPNMSELFATPSGSAQFASAPNDPCRTDTIFVAPASGGIQNINNAANPNRNQLLALCSAQINAWGGNGGSDFHTDPLTFNTGGGAALIVGNPALRNEQGDTWTAGVAFSSPFTSPLANRITATVDWYEALVTDPIEVTQTAQIVSSCFNVNGLNPTYNLDDPLGFCELIERNPSTGAIERVYNSFGNQGKLVIRGIDVSMNWSAALGDMGLESAPGLVSLSIIGNYIIDQIQRYGAAFTDDYAGYGGASPFRANTTLGYTWGNGNRVALNWQYRQGTRTATTYAVTANATGTTGPQLTNNLGFAGYHTSNTFGLSAGTRFGKVSAQLNITNLLDTAPKPGGYDYRDPLAGYGSFSPFDDLNGRRYGLNLSVDF